MSLNQGRREEVGGRKKIKMGRETGGRNKSAPKSLDPVIFWMRIGTEAAFKEESSR
jgi:hypothetical protein